MPAAARSNRKIVLVKRPEGALTADCFQLVEDEVGPLADGQLLVATEHLSIDAFILEPF